MSIVALALLLRRLRLDGGTHSPVAASWRHGEEVGALVDQDVVSLYLVAAAVDARFLEQLDLSAALVELDPLRLALKPHAFLLRRLGILPLPEAHRVACRRGVLVAFGVLAHDDAIG